MTNYELYILGYADIDELYAEDCGESYEEKISFAEATAAEIKPIYRFVRNMMTRGGAYTADIIEYAAYIDIELTEAEAGKIASLF